MKEEKISKRKLQKALEIFASISNQLKVNYDEEDILRAEKTAEKINQKNKGISEIWNKIQVLFLIAKHPTVWGPQFAIPAAATILYLVLPLDAIPDLIPVAGYLDDIAVIGGNIALIAKQALDPNMKEKILEIRKTCPENLIHTFDEMFKVQPV